MISSLHNNPHTGSLELATVSPHLPDAQFRGGKVTATNPKPHLNHADNSSIPERSQLISRKSSSVDGIASASTSQLCLKSTVNDTLHAFQQDIIKETGCNDGILQAKKTASQKYFYHFIENMELISTTPSVLAAASIGGSVLLELVRQGMTIQALMKGLLKKEHLIALGAFAFTILARKAIRHPSLTMDSCRYTELKRIADNISIPPPLSLKDLISLYDAAKTRGYDQPLETFLDHNLFESCLSNSLIALANDKILTDIDEIMEKQIFFTSKKGKLIRAFAKHHIGNHKTVHYLKEKGYSIKFDAARDYNFTHNDDFDYFIDHLALSDAEFLEKEFQQKIDDLSPGEGYLIVMGWDHDPNGHAVSLKRLKETPDKFLLRNGYSLIEISKNNMSKGLVAFFKDFLPHWAAELRAEGANYKLGFIKVALQSTG